MPHFVIEYTRTLEQELSIDEVMNAVFEAGAASEIINPPDIKVRAIAYDHGRLEGGIDTFLHVTISMLEGRSNSQKEQLSISLRDMLDSRFATVGSISIDIRDMNPTAYKKRLLKPS